MIRLLHLEFLQLLLDPSLFDRIQVQVVDQHSILLPLLNLLHQCVDLPRDTPRLCCLVLPVVVLLRWGVSAQVLPRAIAQLEHCRRAILLIAQVVVDVRCTA